MKIEDGSRGNVAQVDEELRLHVKSVTLTGQEDVSRSLGRSFLANAMDTAPSLTTLTGNTSNLMYLQNTATDKNLIIERVTFSNDVPSLVGATVLGVALKNMVLGSIGANDVHIPVNLNFGSGVAAEALCHTWDESGTAGLSGLTAGVNLGSIVLGVGPIVAFEHTGVTLGPGDNIVLRVVNGSAGSNENTVHVLFHYLPLP